MKNFYLILNPCKTGAVEMAERIKGYLEARGCSCPIQGEEEAERWVCEVGAEPHRHIKEIHTIGHRYTDAGLVPENTECIITLGGDGTLIQAARDLAGRGIPMIGINMGHVGYLTQASGQEEITGFLDELIANEYQLEKRMMLKGSIWRDGRLIQEDIALNEVVIVRREMLRLLKLKVYVNDAPLNLYQADGLILATPTGSTAYNLSAGGPIVEPTAKMTILTPICSHALNGRSIVLSSRDRIEIEVLGDDDEGQAAVFDGDTMIHLKVGDRIRVERSEIETILLNVREISFLDNLRNKLAGI